MTQYPIVACPTCAAPVEWRSDNPTRPFCGERCKLIDLGAWAAEDFRMPAEAPPEDAEFGDPKRQP